MAVDGCVRHGRLPLWSFPACRPASRLGSARFPCELVFSRAKSRSQWMTLPQGAEIAAKSQSVGGNGFRAVRRGGRRRPGVTDCPFRVAERHLPDFCLSELWKRHPPARAGMQRTATQPGRLPNQQAELCAGSFRGLEEKGRWRSGSRLPAAARLRQVWPPRPSHRSLAGPRGSKAAG